MGRPELAADERFADGLSRHSNQDALDAEISAWSATQEHYDAFHALQAAGVPCSPVLDVGEVATDPQLCARGHVPEAHATPSPARTTTSSPRSATCRRRRCSTGAAPRPWASTTSTSTRSLLGYTDDEYQWFVDNGHAGTSFLSQRAGNRRAAAGRPQQQQQQ